MSKETNIVLTDEEINTILKSCEQYRARLIQYCLQYFGCEYEYAEDCVQDAYVAMVENLKNGIEIRNHKAWLYTVVLNHKNKALKDKIKRNEYEFVNNEEKDAALNNTLTYEPDYLEAAVSDKTIEERAMKIISSLNEDEKKLYFAYYTEGKKLKEISDVLGVSQAAIRKRHTALKRKIHKMIKEIERE